MFKALVADDEQMIRNGIVKLLAAEGDIEVVAEAEDGEIALEMALLHNPDLLLVDVNMPFLNGLDFIERLKLNQLKEEAAIIVITGYDNFAFVQKALQLGVFDYLLKPIMEDTFYDALSRAKQYLYQATDQSRYLTWAKNELEKNRPSLIQAFLNEWFAGQLCESEIAAQLQYLNLHIHQPFGITVVRAKCDERTMGGEQDWDENLLYYATQNIAQELYDDLKPCICGKNTNGDFLILSAYQPQDNWNEKGKNLQDMLESILPVQFIVTQATGTNWDVVADVYHKAMEQLVALDSLTPIIAQAKQIIDKHYSEQTLSLQWVANKQHISTHYLSRLFKHESGITFVDYVTQVRIRKAVEMLLSSDMKVYEIAERVGYSTQHYFSNAFKKLLGLSPVEYRKRKLK